MKVTLNLERSGAPGFGARGARGCVQNDGFDARHSLSLCRSLSLALSLSLSQVSAQGGREEVCKMMDLMRALLDAMPEAHARFHLTESVFQVVLQSQLPHKFVTLFFTLVKIKDELTDLWGN
jgi:hypothetical protein